MQVSLASPMLNNIWPDSSCHDVSICIAYTVQCTYIYTTVNNCMHVSNMYIHSTRNHGKAMQVSLASPLLNNIWPDSLCHDVSICIAYTVQCTYIYTTVYNRMHVSNMYIHSIQPEIMVKLYRSP